MPKVSKATKTIIPDLRQHIHEKVTEIVKMDANASRHYDTTVGWAFFQAVLQGRI